MKAEIQGDKVRGTEQSSGKALETETEELKALR